MAANVEFSKEVIKENVRRLEEYRKRTLFVKGFNLKIRGRWLQHLHSKIIYVSRRRRQSAFLFFDSQADADEAYRYLEHKLKHYYFHGYDLTIKTRDAELPDYYDRPLDPTRLCVLGIPRSLKNHELWNHFNAARSIEFPFVAKDQDRKILQYAIVDFYNRNDAEEAFREHKHLKVRRVETTSDEKKCKVYSTVHVPVTFAFDKKWEGWKTQKKQEYKGESESDEDDEYEEKEEEEEEMAGREPRRPVQGMHLEGAGRDKERWIWKQLRQRRFREWTGVRGDFFRSAPQGGGNNNSGGNNMVANALQLPNQNVRNDRRPQAESHRSLSSLRRSTRDEGSDRRSQANRRRSPSSPQPSYRDERRDRRPGAERSHSRSRSPHQRLDRGEGSDRRPRAERNYYGPVVPPNHPPADQEEGEIIDSDED